MEKTGAAYRHLFLLYKVKSIPWLPLNHHMKDEARSAAQSNDIPVAKEKAAIAPADEVLVQVGTVLGKILRVDERINLVRFIIFVHNSVDPHVPL